MRVGVLLLPTDPWPETVARVRRLEELGYDHVWTYDHLSWRRYRDRPWHAAIPWLTGLAAATTTIRLGTMVSSPNVHHPLVLAKEAMTLDHVSDGRFTLGIGAGGVGFDATVLGNDQPTPRERAERLDEFVQVTDGLLRNPAGYSHRGERYVVDDARLLPGCVQRPRLPLAIAAGGRRTLQTAARYADAWITYGDTSYEQVSAEATERIVREQAAILEAAAAAAGRDPSTIGRVYLIGNTEDRPLASVNAFDDFAGRYRALGFTDIVFHHPRPGDDPVWNEPEEIVERIAVEVLPHLR